jgi:hypothetical protein
MIKATLAVCLFTISSIRAQDVPSADVQKQHISIAVDTSILLALSKFGSEKRIPIGIVLETNKPRQLCEETRQVTIRDEPLSDFLDALLARSGYAWSAEDSVIVVHPTHIADQVSRVLNIKLDEFGPFALLPTTMQSLGILLASRTFSELHPENKSSAGSILSSSDAEHFPDFLARNATVKQVLNEIVKLGSKGMWIFRLDQDFEHKRDIELHTYSYKDDANTLRTICSSGSY